MRRIVFMIGAFALLLAVLGHAQDSPSLGDVARQTRAQKQQKDAQAKDAAGAAQTGYAGSKTAAKTPHVITNEELPAHTIPAHTIPAANTNQNPHTSTVPDPGTNAHSSEAQGEHWKAQIQAQKSAIANLEKEIAELSSSIHYAGGECVYNCAQWNERQQQKQQQVESMKAQLEEQKQRLEDMQESARRQGFGSSVYDP